MGERTFVAKGAALRLRYAEPPVALLVEVAPGGKLFASALDQSSWTRRCRRCSGGGAACTLALAFPVAAALLALLLSPVEQSDRGGFADVLMGEGARFAFAPLHRLMRNADVRVLRVLEGACVAG